MKFWAGQYKYGCSSLVGDTFVDWPKLAVITDNIRKCPQIVLDDGRIKSWKNSRGFQASAIFPALTLQERGHKVADHSFKTKETVK